jgi:hypothetical protein
MRAFTKIAAAAVLSFAMAGAANATVLVDVATSGNPGADQIHWDGTGPNEGTVTVSGLHTFLNFNDSLFADGAGTDTILTLNGATNGGGFLDTDLANFTQMGIDGTFEFRRASDNVLLLGGTFTDFWLTGVLSGPQANSGNLTSVGGSVTLTSDVVNLNFLDTANAAFAFSNSHPAYSITGNQLNDFTANSLSGTFGGAVPEPGTWALMIVGFGAAGAMVRSRRKAIVAA